MLKPLCLNVLFTGSRNYLSGPPFSLSEGSRTLKIACPSSKSRHVDRHVLAWVDSLWIPGRAVITPESIWNRMAQSLIFLFLFFLVPAWLMVEFLSHFHCLKASNSTGSTGKTVFYSSISKIQEKSTIFHRSIFFSQLWCKWCDLKMNSLN